MSSSPYVGETDGSHINVEENDDLIDLEEMPTPGEATTTTKRMTRKRKFTSTVWNHFDILPEQPDKKRRCKCKHCGIIYLADSKYGTGNMKRHISTCVRKDMRDVGQLLINSGSMSLSGNKFDAETFRDLLTGAIIMHDLPFQFMEFEGIRAVLTYLKPDLHIVTRNTCKADCLKMFKREKQNIKSMLEVSPGRICLTSDCWSSLTTDGYICLTAHFVDKEWVLRKRILNFCYMPPPHNGISLSEKIHNFLCDWGIDLRVFTLTLDNASANDTCASLLKTQLLNKNGLVCGGKYLHMRCWAHILNLVVQDGLKCIDSCVTKIRECVKYVKGSHVRKQKFLECVAHSSLDSKKGLRQDVPTRWNSTYIMLESALYYRRAFMHLELSDSNFKHCPSRDEWEKVDKIKKFLALFYAITNLFSGSKYPTANMYFPLVVTAYLRMKDEVDGFDEYMSSMVAVMLEKFKKYWEDFNKVLAMAIIMDPRYKFHFVDWSYKMIYGVEMGKTKVEELRWDLKSLFDHYVDISQLTSKSTSLAPTIHNASESCLDNTSEDLMKVFVNILLVLYFI
ncbi:Tam3-transposase (Ac family) protein [Dioscorea alata]|uniref:Tam3-transposase (Ac family) protein n=1 Tax=Dioscorea alata TaxID=55571 RepID=A0ACB7UHW6_DIOAL|nr:Tam3-transposase (Ac family) protein [Dioscorea alata]